MKQVEKILKTAAAEIGYKEAKTNKTKYGKAYGLYGQPWCVIFQWWVFQQSGLPLLFLQWQEDRVLYCCQGLRSWPGTVGHIEVSAG